MLGSQSVTSFFIRSMLPVVGVEVLFLPLTLGKNSLPLFLVGVVPWLFTCIIGPAYLAVVAARFALRSDVLQTLAVLAITVASVLVGFFLCYVSWGVPSGTFWQTDRKGLQLLSLWWQMAFLIALLPPISVAALRLVCSGYASNRLNRSTRP